MAHFAKLDENNIVTKVVVVHNDVATSESAGAAFLNNMYGTSDTWKQTSYNTYGNQHKLGGTPFRKNYAGVGFTYDASNDAFIDAKPFDSFTLNDSTYLWESPITFPDDGKSYYWNETLYQSDNSKGWVEL
jgi:hypothetical protein|tara:strand:+ start:914 stop:1306 length:393 start_codon:yes stop_codon:yes gene_type:complete